MCDSRHYDLTAVTTLQQVAATVAAEQRRQHRAELAQELRQRIMAAKEAINPVAHEAAYKGVTLNEFLMWLDELSPAVECDDPAA